MEHSQEKETLHQRVTRDIVKAIEVGAASYEMPWHTNACAELPRNAHTGTRYNGINVITLWAAAHACRYDTSYWASYLQWKKCGAQVRRNEKATSIVYSKTIEETNPATEYVDTVGKRLVLRYSSVFNAAQVDGWSPPQLKVIDQVERISIVEAFIENIGADIQYGSTVAGYAPQQDKILMPYREAFVPSKTRTATEAFYSVLFHEHVHWSGHVSRLDRDLTGRFGSEAYAMEELIAELGAAFLCAEKNFSASPRDDHASYVSNWLNVLARDDKAIFLAASLASKASFYLSEFSGKE